MDVVPKYRMDFGRGERLAQFSGYRFFTLAIPYLYGRFTDQPLADFLSSCGGNPHLMYYRFERRIFDGLDAPDGDSEWNYVLFGIEREMYQALEEFILSVVLVDHPARQVFRIGAQDVTILDPLWHDRHPADMDKATAVEIVSFGLDATKWRLALQAASDWKSSRPALRSWPPDPTTLRYGEALFRGDNPCAVLEKPVVLPPPGSVGLKLRRLEDLPEDSRRGYEEILRGFA